MVHGRVVNYLRGQCITSIICARGLDHRKCGQQARKSSGWDKVPIRKFPCFCRYLNFLLTQCGDMCGDSAVSIKQGKPAQSTQTFP